VPAARRALLDSLAAAAARDPIDPWIAGQRVRYLIEAGDAGAALDAARQCAADVWWCRSLRGLALHALEHIAEASAAFDSAVESMPDAPRCHYTDVSPWLEGDARSHFSDLPCPDPSGERDSVARALWRAADPFGGREASEARVVFLARRTAAALLSAGARAGDERWGDDMEELGLRYGFATRWARQQSTSSNDPWPVVVGHEPLHALAFSSQGHAVARFPVAGADTVLDVVPRASRFRRGDSLLVVVAFDAAQGFEAMPPTLRPGFHVRAAAALVPTDDSGAVRARSDSVRAVFLLRAPNAPAALFVDALDSASRRALRGRGAIGAMAADAGLSDVLLVRAERVRGRADVPLDSLLDAVDGRASVEAGESIGLYWEAYRAPSESDSLRVELRIVPTTLSLAARLAAALRLRDLPAPQTIAWQSPPRSDAGDGHSLVVDTTGLPPGGYRLELWLRGRGPDVMSSTELRIGR
jgi:hypothetical protein